jgi:hypothetical protein
MEIDYDPESRRTVEQMRSVGDSAQLQDAFGTRLAFGELPHKLSISTGHSLHAKVTICEYSSGSAWVQPWGFMRGAHSISCEAHVGQCLDFGDDGLSFHPGTAGLRALDGPGFNRMNRITVKQTTQGLVRYLQQQEEAGWDLRCGDGSSNMLTGQHYLSRGIVLGFDGRTNSRK